MCIMIELLDTLFDLIQLIGMMIIMFIVPIGIFFLLYKQWYRTKKQDKLLSEAKRYNELCKLQNDIKPYIDIIEIKLDTLSQFQKYNSDKCISDCYDAIDQKYNYIHSLKIKDRIDYILSIPYSEISWINERERMKEQTINNMLKQPVTVRYRYVTPAGRRCYSDMITVTENDLYKWIEEKEADRLYKASEQYRKKEERGKLTPGLRYDILKRDNFKCQICGRTQSDGVTLEVDHKVPIAKGGKTEPDNLWTLCRDCNRGKSDKYDDFDDMQLIDEEIDTEDYYIET